MAKAKDVHVPHLAEAFGLAQVLAPSMEEAEQLVLRAFGQVGERNRFALLAAVVQESSVIPVIPARTPAEPRPTALEAPDPQELTAATQPVPPILARILEQAREGRLVEAFATLAPTHRLVAYLGSRGVSTASDLGTILGLPAETAEHLWTETMVALGTSVRESREVAEELAIEDLALLATALSRLSESPSEALRGAVGREVTLRRQPPKSGRRRGKVLPMLGIVLLSVAAALVVTRIFPRADPPQAEPAATDVVELAAAILPDLPPQLTTSDFEAGKAWLEDRSPWRFALPRVPGLPLIGVGMTNFAGSARVPTLYYGTDNRAPTVSVAVINYAVLDRQLASASLDRETLDRLADGAPPENRTIEGRSAVIVRHRDDLYIAVASGIDVDLAAKIRIVE